MGTKKHAPGTFSWCELMTTDIGAAKKFYGDIFGWQVQDDPMPDGGVYGMIRHADGDVGGMFGMNQEMLGQGIPPHWGSYVTVESADTTAQTVTDNGGTVVRAAFDVMDAGRMAVLSDPTGAIFSVWQPKAHTGTDHTGGRVGSMVWNELLTNDVDKAKTFYASVFGWGAKVHEAMQYTEFQNGDVSAAGMMAIRQEFGPIPPNWVVYFGVDDCDATVAKTTDAGGACLMPPMDIPGVGRIAWLSDPQGAVFALLQRGG